MQRLKFFACLSVLLILMCFLAGCDCECEPPEIDSMNPNSGPAGTIVEVVYTKGAISGVIVYEGAEVPTQAASSIGLGKTLRFTIPYDAPVGPKDVQVRSDGKLSPVEVFTVTAVGVVPVPVVDGYEVADSTGHEITVFGSNFSTLSQVFIDGVEVDRYAGNSLPFRTLPFEFVDNAIICTPATDLDVGVAYNITVTNPGGVNSNVLNVAIPSRVITMEFDALTGVPIPDYYIWRNNTVNTFRRTYNNGGWIVALVFDDTSAVDPFPGVEWTVADNYSFWQANADTNFTGYYMHGQYISDGPTDRGRMFMWTGRIPDISAAHIRQGFSVYWDDFAGYAPPQTYYFRTALHESAHGFNLQHSDASANQTIMTVTPSLAAGWHMFFSNTSRTHLTNHNLTDVAPGGTDFGAQTCH